MKESFKSYIKSKAIDKIASIIATILSFCVGIIGLSKLSLTVFWHYIVAFLALISAYGLLLGLILLIFYIYFRFFVKANIHSDGISELKKLKSQINGLYEAINEYSVTSVVEYKNILELEIENTYKKYGRQLHLIKEYAFNNELSKENHIDLSQQEYNNYLSFKDYVKRKMNYKD